MQLMQLHWANRLQGPRGDDHYLGQRTQNEFVQVVADNVNKIIVDRITGVKYYSFILDYTPDSATKSRCPSLSAMF